MRKHPSLPGLAGSSMLTLLMVIAILSSCIIAALNLTSQTNRNVERSNALRRAFEIGDGALEHAFAHWRETCRASTNLALPTSSFSGIPAPPTPAPSPVPIPYTLSDYKVLAANLEWKGIPTGTPVPNYGMSQGTVEFHYLASAKVKMDTLGGQPIELAMRRIFSKSQKSPWNYAIFYVDDLEHHPGSDSTVTGWVHTNGKLYTSYGNLIYQSKVSYGDNWIKNFKDRRRTASPQPGPSWNQTLPPFREQGQQPFGLNSSQIVAGGTSQNDDSYRELIEVPVAGADPIADARYYNQADVKVLVDNAGTKTIRNKTGTLLTSASTGNDKLIYDAVMASVSVGATITDKREAATVRLVDVNVQNLVDSLTAVTGFSGVVYLSDQSGSATTKRAVRLKNGATISRPAGITFATDNGLYIQGDYNTGRTASASPPSNSGNEAIPTVPGYSRKPTAVIADGVMILSNAWSDANSAADLGSRIASHTTINTAIVSGIVPTVPDGDYNGGAENFPRLLERWTGQDFTYYGSMVQLYTSQQFNTRWKDPGTGNQVYDAAARRWFFDENFYTTPPPGTLKLVSYNKGRWFLE